MNQTVKTNDIKTVYCIALEGDVGGVDWYDDENQRAARPRDSKDIFFDLDVPVGVTDDEITELADSAAWEKWYQAGRADCRLSGPLELYKGTLDWNPNDNSEGDYATEVWATSPEDAIRRIAEEMADSKYGDVDTEDRVAYIESVVRDAGQYAVELVQASLERDLAELLQHRPADLAAIKAILNASTGPVEVMAQN